MAIRHLSKITGVLSFAVIFLLTTHAEAATADKIGDVLNRVTGSLVDLPKGILSAVCYLFGLLFSVQGIFKFKEHVDGTMSGHGQGITPLSEPVKKFLAGGMFFAAPFMGSTLQGTLFNNGPNDMVKNSSTHAAPTGGGMDQMIVDFISNLATPATKLVIVFGYISAVILLISGIMRLTKSTYEGPRGPTGLGTWMTFLASGALFSFGDMAGTFSNSLFGTATASTYANIDPTVLSTTDAAQVAPVIEALMIFIMLVGFIAFMRGWFVLKAFADGNHQASIAQGLTFLVGGAMAINMGQLVTILGNTVGVHGISFG